jgi:hypothetical protein
MMPGYILLLNGCPTEVDTPVKVLCGALCRSSNGWREQRLTGVTTVDSPSYKSLTVIALATCSAILSPSNVFLVYLLPKFLLE